MRTFAIFILLISFLNGQFAAAEPTNTLYAQFNINKTDSVSKRVDACEAALKAKREVKVPRSVAGELGVGGALFAGGSAGLYFSNLTKRQAEMARSQLENAVVRMEGQIAKNGDPALFGAQGDLTKLANFREEADRIVSKMKDTLRSGGGRDAELLFDHQLKDLTDLAYESIGSASASKTSEYTVKTAANGGARGICLRAVGDNPSQAAIDSISRFVNGVDSLEMLGALETSLQAGGAATSTDGKTAK